MNCLRISGISVKQAVIFILAAIQVLLGIITVTFNQIIFGAILKSQLIVKEGTRSYDAWLETSIPTYTKFFFFNMLNAEGFLEHGEKPRLEEKGPYTFREVERKVNLVWHPDQTVSYRRKKYWYYEPTLSGGVLDDTVITLNMPMLGAVHYSRGSYLMEYAVSDMLATAEAKLFVNRTIRELMFEGYEDPILEVAVGLEDEEENPNSVERDKFAWFYKRNGTTWSDGELRMHTGQGNIHTLGQIVSWNGSNRTEAFPGDCGRVEGSADGLFAPGLLQHAENVSLWSTDSCRKFTFDRRQTTQKQYGLEADMFQLADDVFANGTVCENNSCYENNLPNGVQNVTNCKIPSPSFLSRPNFYKADDYYTSQFQTTMDHNPAEHESYMMIEPHTSIPLKVQMALQVNVKLEPCPGVEYVFKALPTVYFPVLWFQSSVAMPEDMAGLLQTLIDIPNIMMMMSWFGIAAGVLGMCCIVVRVQCVRRQTAGPTPGATPSAGKARTDYTTDASIEEKETLRSKF